MTRSIGSGTRPSGSRPTWTCRPRRRRQRTEFAATAAEPSASIETCAPPPVISPTAAARSGPASTVTSAPSARARSSAAGATSTATTRAPRAEAIITADSPTPPQPCTASQSPARTRPCAVTARNAVANRQPRHAAVTKSTDGRQRDQVRVGRVDGHELREGPGPGEPRLGLPRAHLGVAGQAVLARPQPQANGTVTRSPACHRVTSGPVATTIPANSCPPMCGSATGSCPFQACQSDRHTPVAPTAMTTPSAGHAGSATSITSGSDPVARNRPPPSRDSRLAEQGQPERGSLVQHGPPAALPVHEPAAVQHGQVLGDGARRDAEAAGQRGGRRGGARRDRAAGPAARRSAPRPPPGRPPDPRTTRPRSSHTVPAPRAGYHRSVWVLVAFFTDHSGQMNTLGTSTTPSGPSVTWPSQARRRRR